MIRHADRLTPGFFHSMRGAGVTSDGLSLGNASPFKRVLGSAASQAATSLETHLLWPPTLRERGKVFARIIDQRVGYETPTMASKSRFESSQTCNRAGGGRAARTLRSSWSRQGCFAAVRTFSASSCSFPSIRASASALLVAFKALASAAFFVEATCAAGRTEREVFGMGSTPFNSNGRAHKKV